MYASPLCQARIGNIRGDGSKSPHENHRENMMRTAFVCVALAATGMAWAADRNPTQRPAEAPSTYRSAFEGYSPFRDQAIRPWRELNEEVQRIGGWKAYAKESAQAREGEAATKSEETPRAAP